MPEGKPEKDSNALAPWALVGQLGMVAAGPIVISVLLGVYLDLGPGLFVVLILAGIAAGIVGAYRVIAPFLK